MGGHSHCGDLHDLPTVDLRQKINNGRDAWDIIDSRCRERGSNFLDIDNSDRFPAFTHNINSRDYPRSQSASSSMIASRTHGSGFAATPPPLRYRWLQ
jgi:hypothetical protein